MKRAMINSCIVIIMLIFACSPNVNTMVIVDKEKVRSVILIDDKATEPVLLAVKELQHHVSKATGAQLEVRRVSEIDQIPSGFCLIHVGPSKLTDQLGLNINDIAPEWFRIYSDDKNLVFLGHDIKKSPSTMWAVCDFLDRELGVRWLWPGELGTFVPKYESIILEKHLDINRGPELQQRRLRYGKNDKKVNTWLLHHRMGTRMIYRFGHAFGNWWEKYHEKHPEYFAVPPPGYKQPWPRPERVKLNIGNPTVADRIIEEWIAAGKSDNWNVCPNDGSGWCTSKASRALDSPELTSKTAEEIWRGNADLAPRFIKFWNSLLRRMRKLNPEVTLSTYAYSAYREAPKGIKLEPGMVMGIVHSFHAYDNWKAWHDAGAKMILRPNWWHMGAVAPHLPLHAAGNFFKFAYEHSIIGFDFDSLMPFWGTQGPYYYLIARLSVRPKLTVDEVIDEWCEAFGSAEPIIREYIDYWENFTEKAAYPVPAGGIVPQNENGQYHTLAKKHNLPLHPLSGSWRVMPYLYTDEVCSPAWEILKRAEQQAAGNSPEVLDRIQFLKDGLYHMELTRDVIRLAYDEISYEGSGREDFAERVNKLEAWRKKLSKRYVIDGEIINSITKRRGVRTAPKDFK